MSELEYRKMDSSEIERELGQLDGWAVRDEKLEREFTFNSYFAGVVFASAVGHLAESLDHHPDIIIGYQKVMLSVNTHAVNGISPYDFELARRISGLLPR
jgi:4a-hydroxytetrahydrobiopterin dehydratase